MECKAEQKYRLGIDEEQKIRTSELIYVISIIVRRIYREQQTQAHLLNRMRKTLLCYIVLENMRS